jgi:CheY-like chemotaxis protein
MTAILVAERDPQVCIVVSEILKYDLLARVVCVDTGTLAAQAIGTASFDLAIIDVNMPDISGYELARHAANRNIPTLLSTGHPDADAELTGSEFPHISKPFRTAELVSRAAIAITRAAENIGRVKASLATIQATAKGLASEMARSSQVMRESKALLAQVASLDHPTPPDVIGDWLVGLGASRETLVAKPLAPTASRDSTLPGARAFVSTTPPPGRTLLAQYPDNAGCRSSHSLS